MNLLPTSPASKRSVTTRAKSIRSYDFLNEKDKSTSKSDHLGESSTPASPRKGGRRFSFTNIPAIPSSPRKSRACSLAKAAKRDGGTEGPEDEKNPSPKRFTLMTPKWRKKLLFHTEKCEDTTETTVASPFSCKSSIEQSPPPSSPGSRSGTLSSMDDTAPPTPRVIRPSTISLMPLTEENNIEVPSVGIATESTASHKSCPSVNCQPEDDCGMLQCYERALAERARAAHDSLPSGPTPKLTTQTRRPRRATLPHVPVGIVEDDDSTDASSIVDSLMGAPITSRSPRRRLSQQTGRRMSAQQRMRETRANDEDSIKHVFAPKRRSTLSPATDNGFGSPIVKQRGKKMGTLSQSLHTPRTRRSRPAKTQSSDTAPKKSSRAPSGDLDKLKTATLESILKDLEKSESSDNKSSDNSEWSAPDSLQPVTQPTRRRRGKGPLVCQEEIVTERGVKIVTQTVTVDDGNGKVINRKSSATLQPKTEDGKVDTSAKPFTITVESTEYEISPGELPL